MMTVEGTKIVRERLGMYFRAMKGKQRREANDEKEWF
jgi:hypothetical protein